MRYLAIVAAAAFLAVTGAGASNAQAVKAGPVALTETQLDSVTAAGYNPDYDAAKYYDYKKYKKDRDNAVDKKVIVKIVKKVFVVNGKKIIKVFKVIKIKTGRDVIVKRHLVKKIVINLKKFKRFAGKKHYYKKYAHAS